MTITDFCLEHRFRPRRVRRRVRQRILGSITVPPGRKPEEEDGWRRDLTEEIGVRAEKPEGHERPSYEVTDAGQLQSWLIAELGTKRLSAQDLQDLADAGRKLYESAYGEGKYMLIHRETREVFDPNAEYFEKLGDILRRVGQ